MILTACDRLALDRVRHNIVSLGGTADTVIPVDLSTSEGCYALAKLVGQVDVLVNNAAETSARFVSILQADAEHWQRQFQLNLYAPLILMQELGVGMVQRRWGTVINVSSVVAQRGIPQHASLSSSKAALEAMSKVAAMELGPHNVNVVVVALGNTDTETLREACEGKSTPEELGRKCAPIRRLVKVEEVAALCVHLAGDESKAITGVVIPIDGVRISPKPATHFTSCRPSFHACRPGLGKAGRGTRMSSVSPLVSRVQRVGS